MRHQQNKQLQECGGCVFITLLIAVDRLPGTPGISRMVSAFRSRRARSRLVSVVVRVPAHLRALPVRNARRRPPSSSFT
jgi:hypothetical protein